MHNYVQVVVVATLSTTL